MHGPKTSALRTRDRYYSIQVRHIKTHSPAKCDRITYSQSRTFTQPLANPVDPVLTAFDWISVFYTVLASQYLFGRVASHGVLLLPVSDTEELFVRATAVPSNTKE